MALTTTNRLGLYRWSSDDDVIIREHIDLSHGNIESYGAKIISGTSLPAVGSAQYARTFFINISDNSLYFYDSEDEFGKWNPINTNIILVTLAENKGDILVATAANEWTILPVGEKNQVLQVVDELSNVGWATILINKGDLLTHNGTTLTNRTVGSNNHVLRADSTQISGMSWGLVDTPSISDGAAVTEKFATGAAVAAKFFGGAATSEKFVQHSVTTSKISDFAVTQNKISDLSILSSKIANNAITEIKFAASSVTSTKFAASSVLASKISNLAVGSFELASLSVTEQKLGFLSVTTNKIIDQNIVFAHFVDGSVTTAKIGDAAVTSAKLADQSISGPKIANAAVETEKIDSLTVGALQIAGGAVVTNKILDSNVTTEKIADLSVTTQKFADGSITTNKIQDLSVVGSKIALNGLSNPVLRQSSGLSVIGNSALLSNDVQDISAATDNTVLQRISGSVGFGLLATASIEDNAITTPKLKDLTIVDADVFSAANINLNKLGPGILPAAHTTATGNYINGSVTQSKLNTSNTSDGIGNWTTYVPTVYVANMGMFGSITYPGNIVASSKYSVNAASYCQLGELVMLRVGITINSSYGYSENSVVSISLPKACTMPNWTMIGSAVFNNADLQEHTQPIRAVVNTTRNIVSFAITSAGFFFDNNAFLVDGAKPFPFHVIQILEIHDSIYFAGQYETNV